MGLKDLCVQFILFANIHLSDTYILQCDSFLLKSKTCKEYNEMYVLKLADRVDYMIKQDKF